ncbi:MAG: TlyA family RNA methyltransferase [Eubacteriales bacterium]|nr:TlyA family RNA methyltransferase [Eubacteriales bacterium]
MPKKRLDALLVEKGFFDSREKAKRSVMAGLVYVNGDLEDKPGSSFNEEAVITVKENLMPFAGRGGLKLEKALAEFGIDMTGKKAIDIGASTGGFTDCMLQHGAIKVYAVDVGYGQLAWKLQQDSRVVVMDRTNIRYVKPEDIGEELDCASIDVSFISLKLVLPVAVTLIEHVGEIICLVKPQFEAGRDKVGKHGVVRERETHKEVLTGIVEFAINIGLTVKGLTFSPVKGPAGNIEYLLYLSKNGSGTYGISKTIEDVVNESHDTL